MLAGAREFGYVVEVAAIPRLDRHEQARFVLSPDPAERTMFATQGGFETSLRLDGVPVLEQLESWIGTLPQAVVVRDRSPRALESARPRRHATSR